MRAYPIPAGGLLLLELVALALGNMSLMQRCFRSGAICPLAFCCAFLSFSVFCCLLRSDAVCPLTLCCVFCRFLFSVVLCFVPLSFGPLVAWLGRQLSVSLVVEGRVCKQDLGLVACLCSS